MKANRKFIEADERAVSAVIGVILMVSITVAIAATVYVYVSGFYPSEPDTVLCGHIKYLPVDSDWKHFGVLQMDNGNFYVIYDIGSSEYSLLKFAYQSNCTVSLVLEYGTTMYNVKGNSVSLLDCGCAH